MLTLQHPAGAVDQVTIGFGGRPIAGGAVVNADRMRGERERMHWMIGVENTRMESGLSKGAGIRPGLCMADCAIRYKSVQRCGMLIKVRVEARTSGKPRLDRKG